MKAARVILLICATLALSSACGETITLHIGQDRIHAEVANTAQGRERGLMGRTLLCPDCGMLFVFIRPERVNFWMKNTPLPLSIAFIAADGTLINTDEMQPNSTNIHSAQGRALYALEMNSGWFSRNGIEQDAVIRGLEQAPKGQ